MFIILATVLREIVLFQDIGALISHLAVGNASHRLRGKPTLIFTLESIPERNRFFVKFALNVSHKNQR